MVGMGIPQEMISQFQNLIGSTINQAKQQQPRKFWELLEFDSFDSLKKFIANVNIEFAQILQSDGKIYLFFCKLV
jgi:hypothetical protein